MKEKNNKYWENKARLLKNRILQLLSVFVEDIEIKERKSQLFTEDNEGNKILIGCSYLSEKDIGYNQAVQEQKQKVKEIIKEIEGI